LLFGGPPCQGFSKAGKQIIGDERNNLVYEFGHLVGKKMKLNKQQRELLKNKYGGKCAYCGGELGKRWHADHLKPVHRYAEFNCGKHRFETKGMYKRENDIFLNLLPSCPRCNLAKSDLELEKFRSIFRQRLNSLYEYNNNYKLCKDFGVITENKEPVIFYFEKKIKEVT
jgi:ssDNA-binding Zn-finger/Zn-ribbon topoisomerase 1